MSHAASKRDNMQKAEMLLITSNEGVSAIELADYLGVDRTTAHRYLQEFDQEYGLIEVSYGRFRLDPDHYVSNVKLSIAEALSIYLALRRFARQTTHAPNFVISALRKIAPALRHPHLTDGLVDASESLQHDRLASEMYTAIWETLIRGWREGIVVRIEHTKLGGVPPSVHEIEPYLFEPAILSHGNYIIAWSRTRNELRTFKIARINQAMLTTAKFTRPADFDINELLRTAWGIWYGKNRVTVELRFSPTVAQRVLETRWHPSQHAEILPDGGVYWSVEVAATLELHSWVRGWGPAVEVLGPPDFRAAIAEDLRATVQLYEQDLRK